MYWFPILLVVAGNIVYHLGQKSMPREASPLVVTVVAYLVAMTSCLALIPLVRGQPAVTTSLRALNWSPVLVGIGIVAVELGFLLAYRAGWQLSLASLTANAMVAVVLAPLGLLVFRESWTPTRGVGALLCVVGLWLVSGRG